MKPYLKQTLRILLSPPAVVFLASLVLLTFSLTETYKVRPFNSDDVSWQNILLTWRPYNGHRATQGATDVFVDKIPFYLLFGHFFKPSRHLLLLEAWLVEIFGFGLFYLTSLYFLKRQKRQLSYTRLLPFIWLASFGYAFAQMYLISDWRGPELGISFLIFLLCAHLFKLRSEIKLNALTPVWLLLVSAVIGLMIYSDPYFLYFTVGPLLIFASWLRIRRQIVTGQLVLVLAAAILSLVFDKITQAIAVGAGIKIMVNYPVQFVTYDNLFGSIANAFHGLLIIFGADFFGNQLFSTASVSGLLNFILLLIIIGVICAHYRHYISERLYAKNSIELWQVFFAGLCILVTALYTLSTVAIGLATYRYFIILLFAAILLLSLRLEALGSGARHALSLLLILATIGNITVATQSSQNFGTTLLTKPVADNRANAVNYDIIHKLEDVGIHKGYANYWEGAINTYLSDRAVNALPTICSMGTTVRFHWLIDESQFDQPATSSFYITDPDFSYPPNCSTKQLNKQFGSPVAIYHIDGKTIYVYDYDIGGKMPG